MNPSISKVSKNRYMSLDPLRNKDDNREYADLRLGDIGELGDCVADFDGEDISVFGGIPGELVRARIYRYRRRKRSVISGMVCQVIEPSPHRVEAPCPNFGPCSGCQWQHIDYDHQLELKRRIVSDSFSFYSTLSDIHICPTVPAPSQFEYRNHARFTVRFGGQMGFSNRITRRFVRIDQCMLMEPEINKILEGLQDKVSETTNLSVRVGANTGDRLIQPTLHAPEVPFLSGQKWYTENLKGRTFRVASPSFFQVNTPQSETLIDLVSEHLALTKEQILVDAYAGVGTFAAILASSVKKVFAIEESASAVSDAASALSDVENLEFLLGKTEKVLGEIDDDIDALILDPPRIGCHVDTLKAVIDSRPLRVAYVSCDPSSLARDLDILVKGNYRVMNVQPVDMFPQTYHVECVASLSISS